MVASKLATSTVPNVVGLLAGHPYQISDLFTALLTISANDAAIALTQAAGSYRGGHGADQRRGTAPAGRRHRRVDPNGLDAPGQHTSAYDLALIARQALSMPAFLKYDQTNTALFPVSAKKSVGLYNQNSLLTSYPGAIGGKIGWTSAGGRHLRRDGQAERRHAHRDAAALPGADRDRLRGKPAQLGFRGRREGHPGRHAGRPAGRRPPPPASRASGAPGAPVLRHAAAVRRPRPVRPVRRSRPRAPRSHPAAGAPSGLAAAGFTGVVVVGRGPRLRLQPPASARRSGTSPRA